MAETRIVVEQGKCEHGLSTEHLLDPPNMAPRCPGPSHRVLESGSFILIEKVDGEWPDWAVDQTSGTLRYGPQVLDALARGEG